MRIIAIYRDRFNKYADPYTVLTDEVAHYRDDGTDSIHDQYLYLGCGVGGKYFSQFGGLDRHIVDHIRTLSGKRFRKNTHMGRLIDWADLDADTQAHIRERVFDGGKVRLS